MCSNNSGQSPVSGAGPHHQQMGQVLPPARHQPRGSGMAWATGRKHSWGSSCPLHVGQHSWPRQCCKEHAPGTGVVSDHFSIRREPGGESLQNHSSRSAALKAIQEKDVLAQFCWTCTVFLLAQFSIAKKVEPPCLKTVNKYFVRHL